jgi:hypothetical protein
MKHPWWSVVLLTIATGCSSTAAVTPIWPTSSPTVPSSALAPCYAHPGLVDPASCVANTLPGMEAQLAKFPSSPPPGTTPPSRTRIAGLARQVAGAPSSADTEAELTTYGVATTRLGGSGNPVLTRDLPVWLVTVHAPMDVSRVPGDTTPIPGVYTVVMDAANGALIDSCAGCNVVR